MHRDCKVALFTSEYPPHISGGLGVHVDRVTAAMEGLATCDVFVPARGDYACGRLSVHLHEISVPQASNEMDFWLGFCQAAASTAQSLINPVNVIHCHDWMTVIAGIRYATHLTYPWFSMFTYRSMISRLGSV